MKTWSDFETKLNDYYGYVISEFKDNKGYKPIISGQELQNYYEEDIDIDKWYFCRDYFHNGDYKELSKVDYSDEIFDDTWTNYSEAHNDTPYFEDYKQISELEPKFLDELSIYFKQDQIDKYKDDISWLLDEYAFRRIFKRLYEVLQRSGN